MSKEIANNDNKGIAGKKERMAWASKNLGNRLLVKSGDRPVELAMKETADVLANKRLLGLYFSAHWVGTPPRHLLRRADFAVSLVLCLPTVSSVPQLHSSLGRLLQRGAGAGEGRLGDRLRHERHVKGRLPLLLHPGDAMVGGAL